MKVGDLVTNEESGVVGVVIAYSPEIAGKPQSQSNPSFMRILTETGMEWIVGTNVGTDKSSWKVVNGR